MIESPEDRGVQLNRICGELEYIRDSLGDVLAHIGSDPDDVAPHSAASAARRFQALLNDSDTLAYVLARLEQVVEYDELN